MADAKCREEGKGQVDEMADKPKVGTWDVLKMHPTKLMRLVIENKADIIGKDEHGRYIYSLREAEAKTVT